MFIFGMICYGIVMFMKYAEGLVRPLRRQKQAKDSNEDVQAAGSPQRAQMRARKRFAEGTIWKMLQVFCIYRTI